MCVCVWEGGTFNKYLYVVVKGVLLCPWLNGLKLEKIIENYYLLSLVEGHLMSTSMLC